MDSLLAHGMIDWQHFLNSKGPRPDESLSDPRDMTMDHFASSEVLRKRRVAVLAL